MNFLKRHRSKVLTFVGIAAPVIGGLVTGGIFTAATIGTALGVIAMKYSASPINHDAEKSADLRDRLERLERRKERP